MKAVVQRVGEASVTVDGEVTGAIGRGLLVYLGVGLGDTPALGSVLLAKILNLRVFENIAGKMDRSLLDLEGQLLVVSQFTLFANTRKGRRPSFEEAMPPVEAELVYNAFITEARTRLRVATGRFRADMRVSSVGEGPVTLILEQTNS